MRVVSFTGATQAGRASLRSAADQVREPAMEFDGNARLIVFEDVDLGEAAPSRPVQALGPSPRGSRMRTR